MRNKRFSRRLFAVMMVFVMMVGLLPAAALAGGGANSPPAVVSGQEIQAGVATPASGDGNLPAVAYTVYAGNWFTDADGDPLTYSVVSAAYGTDDISADVSISDGTITYTPAAAQANSTVTIEIKATDGASDSTGNVTIAVTVNAVPADTGGAQPPTESSGQGAQTGGEMDLFRTMTLADGGTHIDITDGKGLAGVDFDAEVEYTKNGTTFDVKVPNGTGTVTVYFTPGTNAIVGTGPNTGTLIAKTKITEVNSVAVPIRAEGSTYTINSYPLRAGTNYSYGATYTFNFSFYFYVTKAVGNQRLVYGQGATATDLSVVAYTPGPEEITYQWQQSANGETYTDIDEATAATFTPPTNSVGRLMYRVKVSNGEYTLYSGNVIVDVQGPETPSNAYALKELVVAGEPSDDAQTVYLSEQPWLTDDLSYTFTIPDTKISTRVGTVYSYSFYVKAVPADNSYGNMRYYYINPSMGVTTPTSYAATVSGQWGYFYLTANGDPIAKVRVGPDAQVALSPTNYLDYTLHARIEATLSSLTADNTMTPAFSPDVQAYAAELPAEQETVTITAAALMSGNAVTVNGQAADGNGAVILPVVWDAQNQMTVAVKVGTDGELTASRTYTLTLNQEQPGETPKISVQPKSATYTDVEQSPAPLYIRANATGALSYQWYRSDTNSSTGGTVIEGAASASYTPEIALINTPEDTSTQQKVTYYYCEATANGHTVTSAAAAVTLIPDPTPYDVRIVTEDGAAVPAEGYTYGQEEANITSLKVLSANRNTSGTWSYYWRTSGLIGVTIQKTQTFTPRVFKQARWQTSCDVTYMVDGTPYTATSANSVSITVYATRAVAPTIDPNGGPKSAYYYTGNTPAALQVNASATDDGTLKYQWYKSTDNAAFSAIYGATGSTYQPETSRTAGPMYYRCVVTDTVASYNGNTYHAAATSKTATLAFEMYERPTISLAGSGTAADPWLITGLDDLKTLQTRVNTDGEAFEDCYFKLDTSGDAGIMLPADWTPVGVLSTFFSGSIDGDGELLTVAEGGLPLLGYVRHATVRNLNIYGEEIAGYGLVQNYVVDYGVTGNYGEYANSDSTTINIDNVTLKSGTRTLKSGFIGGYASGINYVNISNCTVEEGVVIGYDKQQSKVGSFGGSFNGTIANSVSHATVYGVDNAGGLIGEKGQSMGPCRVYNSQFRGTVEATGTYVGGIIGSGYYGNGTAPNTPCVTIQDCLVTGTVKGRDHAGGILGGEPGCESNWANGVGYVQNNLFAGRIESSGTYVGGVAGYILSLDRYNIITNNFYAEGCGASKGIGKIKNVDTSDSHLGRSDDPAGQDADKLARSVTAAALADGTVTAALNSGVNSSGDWTQGNTHPERGTGRYLRAITVSGYQSRYTTNDVVDFAGLTALATYSDGSIEPLASGVTFSGYAQKTVGYQTITATYVSSVITYSTVFELMITQGSDNSGGGAGQDITVYFTLLGDTLHGEAGGTHTLKKGGLITWIGKTPYTLPANSFVMDLLAQSLTANGYSWYNENVLNGADGNYIQSIITPQGLKLGEFDNGNLSGWMYTLNGTHPLYGVSEQQLKNGDVVVFHYTDDYTVEEGSDQWGSGSAGGAGNTNAATTLTPTATVSGGTASVSLSLTDMKDAIAGVKTSGGDIVIRPTINGTVTAARVELAKDALSAVAGQTDAGLTVEISVGSITIPNSALAAIASQATGGTVTVSLETVDNTTLTPEQREAVGDDPVYDINVLSGGKNISEFGGESITISLPYTLKEGEDPSNVTVWYLSDAGELEQIACTYDPATGLASFPTDHLSYYVVSYTEAAPPPVPAQTQSFTDVSPTEWFYESVTSAVYRKLMNGTSATTFSPNDPMTRAMLVTVLYRLEGSPQVTGANSFSDVEDNQWYTDAVAWANTNNIVTGYGDNLFGTNDSVTREQLATIIHRYASYKHYDTTKTTDLAAYTDALEINTWALDALQWANAVGLITGRTATTLAPRGSATRAEVAAILMRFVEGVVEGAAE
jgi:hypothetical protein